MLLAVVITTYNRPDALAVVLEAYLAQTDRRFEIVIADDGSTGETAEVIADYRCRAPFPLVHVWQRKSGFRAAAIRNRALAASSADYVVFTDGDCIPLPGFVAGHRRLAERNCFVAGNRVLLSDSLTRDVLQRHVPIHAWSLWKWFVARLKNDVNRLLPLLPLAVPRRFSRFSAHRWQGAKTCNLAVWRDDFVSIDGFDESYTGWGLEDSDLVVRLLHAGVRRKSARFAVPVLHLWHAETARDRLHENRGRFERILRSGATTAARGLRSA